VHGIGAAAFLFMTTAVSILSVIKQSIPLTMIKALNCFVGFVPIFYGLKRLLKRPV